MIINTLKMLLAILCAVMFFYSVSEFEFSYALLIFIALAVFLIVSIFYKPISILATNVSRFVGVISLLAFLLLMLAGTMGGSFRLSESNQVIAALLVSMAFLGLTSFLWPTKEKKNT